MNRHGNPKQDAAWAALVTAAALCLALAPALAAQQVADVRAGGNSIDFLPLVEHGGLVLTVSGPEGFHHRAEFGAGEAPSFSLFDRAGGVLADGSYTWELRANPSEARRRAAFEANQRASRSGGTERLIQSGSFAVLGGAIVAGGAVEPGQQAAVEGPELALRTDILTTNDATIIQSLCVGIDCTSSESFGFDTLRLKENNTRIKFQDTSTGTFPSNDWQLTANDSTNGGQNRFSIDDIDNARTPFTIEAAAPSHSLYVDDGGRIGLGTSTPVVEVHVVDGDTPTLRLDQDGSSGFTAQSYDVAANETNFFVRDNTTGSKLPFRLRPGAPTSSIDVAANGDVGVGTSSPSGRLHVKDGTTEILFAETTGVGIGTASPADNLEVEISGSNGGVTIESGTDGTLPQLTLIEPTRTWRFRVANNGTFVYTDATAGTTPVQILGGANSSLLIVGGTDSVAADADRVTVNGELFIGSTQVTPDYVFEPDYPLESIEEHAEYMWSRKHLPAVGGAVVSDGRHQINVGAQQFGILEELEKAHIYIEQLHTRLEASQEELASLERDTQEIEALRSEVAELKQLVRRLAESSGGEAR